MARYSFRDPSTHVLKCHGYVENNEPGDITQTEPDSFNLDPRDGWQWTGSAWQSYVFPPSQREVRFTALMARLDDIVADLTLPAKLRLFAQALKNMLR